MNKSSKKILGIALVTLLIAVALVGGVSATTYTVGGPGSGATYSSISDALEKVTTGDEIKLLSNVKESVVLMEDISFILDLNGYVLCGSGSDSVIFIQNSGTLILKDSRPNELHRFSVDTTTGLWTLDETSGTEPVHGGCITGGNAVYYGYSYNNGGGVFVNRGNFNMTGGNIVGNTAAELGGGVMVYNGATFNMSGGSIAGNTATNGGGVSVGYYDTSNDTFNMSGGSIAGNTATNGGGVYVCGTMTVGGTADISENTRCNVYLKKDKIISKSTTAFWGDNKIGITLASDYAGKQFTDTANWISGDEKYFSSDDTSYKISFKENHLELKDSRYYTVTINAGENGKIQMGSEPATSSITLDNVPYGTEITPYRNHLKIGTTEITAVPDDNCYFSDWISLPEKVTKDEEIVVRFTSDSYPIYLWDGTDYVNVLELPYSNLKDVAVYNRVNGSLTLKGYTPYFPEITEDDKCAICSLQDEGKEPIDLTIVLAEGTTNILGSPEDPIVAGILTFGNLKIRGTGKLSIFANATNPKEIALGICSLSDIEIIGGNIDITLTPFGTDSSGYSEAGIEAAGNLTISGGKTNIQVLNNSTVCYGIFAQNSINIAGGDTTISGGYYGAVVKRFDTSNFTMTDGKFTCINSLYGLKVTNDRIIINPETSGSFNLQTTGTAIVKNSGSDQTSMSSANQSAADTYFQYEVSNTTGDGGKKLIVGTNKDDLREYQGTLEQAIAEGFPYIYITDDSNPYIDNFAVTINPSKESADPQGYVNESYITEKGSTILTVQNNILTVDGKQITVTANPGYEFDSWENLPDGTEMTVTGELTVTAKFKKTGSKLASSSSVTSFFGEKDGNDFTFEKAVVITKATLPGATSATVTNTSGSGWYTCNLSTDGTSGTVYFQVPLDVISMKGYTINDVSMLGCKTTYLKSENGYAKYSAVITKGGALTIDFEKDAATAAVEKVQEVVEQKQTATEQKQAAAEKVQETVEQKQTTTQTAAKSPFPILGILAGLGIAGFVALRRR